MTPGNRPPVDPGGPESPGTKRFREETPPHHSENLATSTRSVSPNRSNSLATSLGFASWSHGDAALAEALRVKGEQERTKQEYYRLESRQKVLEILNTAMRLNIPGHAIPLLFASNEDMAAANTTNLATASQAATAASAAHHAALQAAALASAPPGLSEGPTGPSALSPQGPFRFMQPNQPGVNPMALPQHVQPPPIHIQHPSTHIMAGQPGPLTSPTTPVRQASIDDTTPSGAGHPNGQSGTPMQQRLQPAFSHGHPGSASRFNVLNFERANNPPDLYRLGHRATASALPTFMDESPQGPQGPQGPQSPQGPQGLKPLVTPQQMTPGQGPVSSGPYYPAQLVAPTQIGQSPSGMSTGMPPHAQKGSPQFAPQHSPVQQIQPPSRHGPLISVTPSRPTPARGRAHAASASASELQIHQWKPKQMTRDNRWKVMTNPFSSRGKEKSAVSEDPSAPPHKAQQVKLSPPTDARSPEGPGGRPSPPSRSPPTSGASVVAAQNSRRRGMSHLRSRSSISALPHPPPSLHPPSPASACRHDEAVSVLADLASEQKKVGHENIKSEPTELASHLGDNHEKPRLPSLLHYLESQAKHLPSPVQPLLSGGEDPSQARPQDPTVVENPRSPRSPVGSPGTINSGGVKK